MLHKNQEVICTNATFDPNSLPFFQNLPVKDKLYTIRSCFRLSDGRLAVWLNEITNEPIKHPSGMGTFEPSFAANRFAPLSEWDGVRIEEELVIEVPVQVQNPIQN